MGQRRPPDANGTTLNCREPPGSEHLKAPAPTTACQILEDPDEAGVRAHNTRDDPTSCWPSTGQAPDPGMAARAPQAQGLPWKLPRWGGSGVGGPAAYWALGLGMTYLAAAFAWLVLVLPSMQGADPTAFREAFPDTPHPGFLQCLVRFDVGHYLYLARHGYQRGDPQVAFHPLYPMMMRGVSWTVFRDISNTHLLLAGLLISAVSSFGAVLLLDRLCAVYLLPAARRLCLILWVLNPTAVFLAMAYTESLFLALVLAAFVAGLRSRWLIAGIVMGLACITRPTGLLAWLSLAIFALVDQRAAESRRPRAPAVLVPALFLATYIAWQYFAVGDPLAVLHAEAKGWSQHLGLPSLFVGRASDTLPYYVALRPDYAVQMALHLCLLFGSILLAGRLCGSPGMPLALKVYALLVILSILCRSSDMSISRLLMASFPLHMTLAAWLAAGSSVRPLVCVALFTAIDVLGTVAFVTGRAFF